MKTEYKYSLNSDWGVNTKIKNIEKDKFFLV